MMHDMTQGKNRLLQLGALFLFVSAALGAVFTIAFGRILGAALVEYVESMAGDAAFAAEVEAADLTMDSLVSTMQGALAVILGAAVVFNVVKMAVGILGLLKAGGGAGFFLAWGIVFLVMGVLSVFLVGVSTVFGLCNVFGGLIGPVLYILGGVQNRRALRRGDAGSGPA